MLKRSWNFEGTNGNWDLKRRRLAPVNCYWSSLLLLKEGSTLRPEQQSLWKVEKEYWHPTQSDPVDRLSLVLQAQVYTKRLHACAGCCYKSCSKIGAQNQVQKASRSALAAACWVHQTVTFHKRSARLLYCKEGRGRWVAGKTGASAGTAKLTCDTPNQVQYVHHISLTAANFNSRQPIERKVWAHS